MKQLFLTLEDGTVFEGWSVNDALENAGLLSFYTGVVGYQEVITNPANIGKIILFTYPMIGNYGINNEDPESASIKVSGIITKEYSAYYSNFRATCSLGDYMNDSDAVFGTSFDTRAVMLHLREHGEMMAAFSSEALSVEAVRELAGKASCKSYTPENKPIACAQASAKVKATVVDLGASKSFYKQLAALGVDACCDPNKADVVIVSDAPVCTVESESILDHVKSMIGNKPAIGFGHGSVILAKMYGGKIRKMSFGDHGCNVPVAYIGSERNDITVQNHNYEVIPGDGIEAVFTNVHDGTCEGFRSSSAPVAGANFLPSADWFDAMLASVGVK